MCTWKCSRSFIDHRSKEKWFVKCRTMVENNLSCMHQTAHLIDCMMYLTGTGQDIQSLAKSVSGFLHSGVDLFSECSLNRQFQLQFLGQAFKEGQKRRNRSNSHLMTIMVSMDEHGKLVHFCWTCASYALKHDTAFILHLNQFMSGLSKRDSPNWLRPTF